jgi:hypothetical protein
MRGLATLFLGREPAIEEITKVLVVCSSDVHRFPRILASVQERFLRAHLTYLVPKEFVHHLPNGVDLRLISDLKTSPIRRSREIRSRHFDVTVLMLTGDPVFRKAKIWAAFTNYRMLFVYNENGDSFACGGHNRMALVRHLGWRLTAKGVPSLAKTLLSVLLFPLGLIYLLHFACGALLRRRIHEARNLENERREESLIRYPDTDEARRERGPSPG